MVHGTKRRREGDGVEGRGIETLYTLDVALHAIRVLSLFPKLLGRLSMDKTANDAWSHMPSAQHTIAI